MSRSIKTPASSPTLAFPSASIDANSILLSAVVMPADLLNTALMVQKAQLEALMSWQRALLELSQELWDEWASRYAGSARIDG